LNNPPAFYFCHKLNQRLAVFNDLAYCRGLFAFFALFADFKALLSFLG
jgi:hypothetical protein